MLAWLLEFLTDEDGEGSSGTFVVAGLFVAAGALWLAQVGGVEGLADGLLSLGRVLHDLARILPWA